MGISVRQPKEQQIESVYKLACLTAQQITEVPLKIEKVQINDQYIGDGYGLPTEGTLDAIKLIAKTEGILLDPVYSGKGLDGMIGMIKHNSHYREKDMVFLHTGGSIALFAYGEQLAASLVKCVNKVRSLTT